MGCSKSETVGQVPQQIRVETSWIFVLNQGGKNEAGHGQEIGATPTLMLLKEFVLATSRQA